MTFKDLIDITLNRVDEDTTTPDLVDEETAEQEDITEPADEETGTTTPDPVALSIIKSGINTAYLLIASSVDPRSKTFEYPYESPKQVPADFGTLINIEHDTLGDLSSNDFEQRADLIYIRNKAYKSGNIKLTYTYQPEKLVADTDIVDVKDMFLNAIAAYGAYVYQLYRRKYSAAQMLMSEFNSFIGGGQVEPE